jgi:hypothetical protein
MIAVLTEERDKSPEYRQSIPSAIERADIKHEGHFSPLAVGNQSGFQIVIAYALPGKSFLDRMSKPLDFAEHPLWGQFELIPHDFEQDIATRVEGMERFRFANGLIRHIQPRRF